MSSEFVAHSTYKTNHSNAFRFVLSHILRHPWIAVGMITGALANAIGAALLPLYTGEAVNAVVDSQDIQTVINLTVTIVLSQLIRGVLQFMRNLCSEIYGQRIERDVRDELYASLLGKSMTFHDSQPVGEIMARVTNDVREMNLMMNPGLNILIGSSMFLIMPIITVPLIHPALVIVPLVFVIFQLFIQYRYIMALHPVAQEVRANFGRMNARLAESLDGLQVIKGAAQEDNEKAYFNALVDAVRDRFIQQGGIEARYLANLTFPLAVVAGFVHSVYLYNLGQINTGDVIAFVSMLYLFTFPVFSSMFSLPRIALGYASAARILSIITAETDLDQNTSGYSQPIKGEITFENVSFGYSADKEALHDISFSIKPGQTVAIVGQTGAGKTTITKLINRTYDTTSGRVLVDGVDVRDWNLEALRSQISVIEQDIFLFSRTIAENIAFGSQEVNQPQIEDAARKAQAHEFISSFPENYQTVIGQRGVTLSGGQRQRIAIARAFQTDPPVLILDDSTSAIDSATEDLIQKAIWAASRGRTTILITHRLSQIRWADHIVVLRKGRVVAQGNHEDLLKSSEAYRRIFARYEGTPQSVNGHKVGGN
jgi:ATP-binding cassette, subfamily B, bacterial